MTLMAAATIARHHYNYTVSMLNKFPCMYIMHIQYDVSHQAGLPTIK